MTPRPALQATVDGKGCGGHHPYTYATSCPTRGKTSSPTPSPLGMAPQEGQFTHSLDPRISDSNCTRRKGAVGGISLLPLLGPPSDRGVVWSTLSCKCPGAGLLISRLMQAVRGKARQGRYHPSPMPPHNLIAECWGQLSWLSPPRLAHMCLPPLPPLPGLALRAAVLVKASSSKCCSW